ncbi:MAG TPA: isochorismatase family protein [Aggregatilineales bacterium]|nr:isochorismatase family protein [Aggregatilineales bacterium]
MLKTSEVPLTQSALLVIDVQDSFKVGPRWERRSNPHFEANISALVEAYRAAHLLVFFVMHTDSDEAFERTSPHFKLMDFLAPRPDEPLIVKDTRNCFTSTNLQAQLIHKDIRRLAITGIQMEQCCETTARVAADLGYAVDFVIDATLTFPIANPDDPADVLGVDDIEKHTVFVLRRRFARIVTTQKLCAELEGISLTVPSR